MRGRMFFGAMLLLLPGAALAHVTLAVPNALPGAQYEAHFRVGHGCDGSPTIALSIAMPDGVSGVAPLPQAGWALDTARDGGRISAVTWKSGTLAADKPGEFVVRMTLPSAPGTLAFIATQTCEKGSESWSELPAADGHKLKNPAPLLHVTTTPAAPTDNAMPDMPGMKM